MVRRFLAIAFFAVTTVSSQTAPSLPSSFQAKTIHSPEGADIFVRWGGSGPVVVLIHGYAENSDSWAPLAADLMKDHTVVVPNLRGIGRSSKPAGGYDKKTQAKDMRAVVTSLGYDKTFVVAHDIGNMVAYAYAATYPDKVERLVVMDAPIPGIDPWNEILLNPGVWHFNFHGPDAERLVAGRERIYFDRIWNDFTGDPGKPESEHKFRTIAHVLGNSAKTIRDSYRETVRLIIHWIVDYERHIKSEEERLNRSGAPAAPSSEENVSGRMAEIYFESCKRRL